MNPMIHAVYPSTSIRARARGEEAPPASDLESRIAALEARVDSLEKDAPDAPAERPTGSIAAPSEASRQLARRMGLVDPLARQRAALRGEKEVA